GVEWIATRHAVHDRLRHSGGKRPPLPASGDPRGWAVRDVAAEWAGPPAKQDEVANPVGSMMARCFLMATQSRNRTTSSGLRMIGSFLGTLGAGIMSAMHQFFLRVTLYRKRSAEVATLIETMPSFFSLVR